MLLCSLLSRVLTQEPASSSEPALAISSLDRQAPLTGKRLLGGGAVACAISAGGFAAELVVAAELEPPGYRGWSGFPTGFLLATPVCLHTVIPGAALRGRADARRDRLAGARQDTTTMRRAGLGLTVAGPLIAGLAIGGTWLIPDRTQSVRLTAGSSLGAMGGNGIAAFATGLSLIARARNYEAEFGRSAGIWKPRGVGSLTIGVVLGAGSVAATLLAARASAGAGLYVVPILRSTFASTLLGAIGTHLYGRWQREHGESSLMERRARVEFGFGVGLVTLAPILAIASGAAELTSSSGCPASHSNVGSDSPFL